LHSGTQNLPIAARIALTIFLCEIVALSFASVVVSCVGVFAVNEETLPRHPFGGGSSPWIVAKTERD
jgi:hypothetical protein